MTSTIPLTVRDTVSDHLNRIETEQDVHIVYAVAHGSHAWGLSNDASDYDVRGVFIPHDLTAYARLSDHRDVINTTFGDYEYELWDIKKFASLLHDSNNQAIDALRSPVAYRETASDPINTLRDHITEHYNPIALYHKYRSVAYNNHRKYLSDHLTSNRDNTYPIIERRDDAYVVRNTYTGDTLTVPDSAVDGNDSIDLAYDQVDLSDKGDPRPCPECGATPGPYTTTFTDTNTKQTVKRNLAVLKAGMSAIYLRETGRDSDHELPDIDFPTFISDQAPEYFDDSVIETAEHLITLKRNGDNDPIGDIAPDHIAAPRKNIDPEIHNTNPPDIDVVNDAITNLIHATLSTTGDTR